MGETKEDNQRYIDRPFNIRPFCFWALFVGLTVILSFQNMWFGLGFIILLGVGLYCVRFIKIKDKVLLYIGRSNVFIIVSVVLCLATFSSFVITQAAFSNIQRHEGTRQVVGVVESFNLRDPELGVSRMVISNVQFGEENIRGRVVVFVNNYDGTDIGIAVGEYVSFLSRLNPSQPRAISINNRTRHSASVRYQNIQTVGSSQRVNHVVTRYALRHLNIQLDERNAGLIYSMMFGDTSALDDDIVTNFRHLGIGHLFAASGLDVGLIMLVLFPFLKFLRVHRKAQLPIVAAVLLFYCYLCGWTPSIVRATLMFLVIFFNRIYLRKSDMLTGICASAVIILVIQPYAIFSWSFQLSYACVFGIALFYAPIERTFLKAIHPNAPQPLQKVLRFFLRAVAMHVTVQIAVMPVSISMFGVFAIYGIISNMFFVPILTLSFCVALISLVTWVGQIFLVPINWLMNLMHMGMEVLTTWPVGTVAISNPGYWWLFHLAGLLFLSRYVFLSRKYRYPIAGILFTVYFASFFI